MFSQMLAELIALLNQRPVAPGVVKVFVAPEVLSYKGEDGKTHSYVVPDQDLNVARTPESIRNFAVTLSAHRTQVRNFWKVLSPEDCQKLSTLAQAGKAGVSADVKTILADTQLNSFAGIFADGATLAAGVDLAKAQGFDIDAPWVTEVAGEKS